MANPRSSDYREGWYENLLAAAPDPQRKFEVLRSRLMADIKKLPEGLRPGMYDEAAGALEKLIETIGDVLDDMTARPTGARR